MASGLHRPEGEKVEVRYIRADGTTVWAFVGATPFFDATGRYDGSLAMVMDITDRKRAQQTLQDLSQRTQRRERILTTMLSSMSDFAYLYDREGRFLFVNQPLLDVWGITLEEAVGKNYFDLGYPEELAKQLHRQVQEVFQTKKNLTDEIPYTNRQGLDGYYECIFSPVFEADGRVEFVAGCTRTSRSASGPR